MKKYILIFLSIFLLNNTTTASHFMGGEITWKCIKTGIHTGKYVFQMKVYRDCSGISFSQTVETITHHNYPAVGQTTPILMNFVSVTDISPTGSASSGNNCFDCNNGDQGAVEEYVWESDPMFLNGNPPPDGWHFTWGSCCRSGQITNGMANDSWTLRAVMYSYTPSGSATPLPHNPCFDSSPEFKELAKTIICNGYPFAYSHNASDEELDDLTYHWAEPLGDSFGYDPTNPNATALTFTAPYTVTEPIPGNPTLDNQTGEISYFSTDNGVFVTCVKVEARKCGQLIAEIYREVQVVLLDCGIYSPPVDGFNDPPTITPAFGTVNEAVVYAGDLVTFNLQAEDFDTYTGGIAQDITLDVSGGQFAADYVSPNLCANPPCATFNNGAGLTPPFSAPSVVNGVFEWQTSCDHLYAGVGCDNTSNVFTFSIKAFDDFCPANGISIATIKITVVPPIPDLRCIAVDDDGDATLTWSYVANAPPTIEPYFVWHSTNPAGPYTMIDSVLFPIDNYTHVGANANLGSQYYFLSNKDGCDTTGVDLHSDTLQSIYMDLTPTNFGMSVDLDWNPLHDPLLPTSDTIYELFMKRGNGAYQSILTTHLLSSQYDAISCSDDVMFYVDIPDESGCISRSSVGIANLADTTTPVVPVITDVSVDANGKSIISWLPSNGADFYEIYMQDSQGSIIVGTVNAPSSSFLYPLSNAGDMSEIFSVRALDSCGNTRTTSEDHNSIYLVKDLDECTHDLTLNWNEYVNWFDSVSHYTVVVEETDLNGLTTVSDTDLVSSTIEYVVNSLKDRYTYNIYIVANSGDSIFSAVSNQLLFVPTLPKKPDYNYLDYATINHVNGFVEVNCLVDNTAIIDHYDVMRSLRGENDFKQIAELPFDGTSFLHYTDENVKTSEEFYQYKIYPVDTCGIRLFPPPVFLPEYFGDTSFAQTILLETEINVEYTDDPSLEDEYTNTIQFNEYDKWLGDVSEYRLYRSINREPFNLLPLYVWDRVNSPNEELHYIDIVSDYGDGNGRFCYYIEAVEGNGTPYGPVPEGSLSNVSCVSQTPIIFVPNVFTPNGDEHNEVFRPFTNFVSEEGYSFTIYSREGEIIFSTNNPLKGWDGRYKGSMVQDGNYVFHLQYINGVGDLTEKTDIVTLVR